MVEYAYSTVDVDVGKNIEAAKVEFDTFLRRDEPTKNPKEPHKTDTLSEISTEIKFHTSQENFCLVTRFCRNTEL